LAQTGANLVILITPLVLSSFYAGDRSVRKKAEQKEGPLPGGESSSISAGELTGRWEIDDVGEVGIYNEREEVWGDLVAWHLV